MSVEETPNPVMAARRPRAPKLPQHKSLDAAFLAAQQEFEPIVKDGYNAERGYHFARLGPVLDAIVPILNKHGIAFRQPTRLSTDGRFLVVVTTLVHVETGDKIESEYPVCDAREGAQTKGATLTYARRYSALAAMGVAPEEVDDDASRAIEGGAPAVLPFIKGEQKDDLLRGFAERLRQTTLPEDIECIMNEAREFRARVADTAWGGLEEIAAQETHRVCEGIPPKQPEPSQFAELDREGRFVLTITDRAIAVTAYTTWQVRASSKTRLATCTADERKLLKELKKLVQAYITTPVGQNSAVPHSPAEEGALGPGGGAEPGAPSVNPRETTETT